MYCIYGEMKILGRLLAAKQLQRLISDEVASNLW
jgi:hypothetical protein